MHILNPLNFNNFRYFFIWSSSLKGDQNIPKMTTTIEPPYTKSLGFLRSVRDQNRSTPSSEDASGRGANSF